ncbi:MAG: crossover junction endodeoxyribonuclease RuvC [Pseudomonadota bacterium]|nr:crossover junction endodeoxyribonuclease RuvC [Pseudomonadota bacterium]
MKEVNQRVLGIDPGSRLTGFGLIDIKNNQPSYITSGIIKSQKGNFPVRLKTIYQSVLKLIQKYNPNIMVIESVFVHKSAGSALKLGHARAAALCASFNSEVEIFEYAPREIKKAVVGNGAASKEQVQHMVVSLLGLDASPAEDAADAIAAALCYSNQEKLQGSLKQLYK